MGQGSVTRALVCLITAPLLALFVTHTWGTTGSGAATRESFSKSLASPIPTEGLRAGDLIVRRGTGPWSETIRKMNTTDTRFSHAGILAQSGSGWAVVHAIGGMTDGPNQVLMTPLGDFVDASVGLAVYRSTDDPELQGKIVSEAKAYLGRPFDHEFSLSDDSKIYCTELVMLAVNRGHARELVRPHLTSNGMPVVLIEACYDAPEWSEVLSL